MKLRQMVGLVVLFAVPLCSGAASLVWTGNVNNAWNVATDANWLNAGVPSTYTMGDTVVFNDNTSQTNINVTVPITSGQVTFSNSTTRTYMLTNNVLGGSVSLLKTNTGTVYFGSVASNAPVYAGSMPFTGGTTIKQGMICYVVTTNAATATNYTAGANLFGFGTAPITIDGGPSVGLRFQLAYYQSAVITLTNDFVIGPLGGKIELQRIQPIMSLQNICGNIDMGGDLSISAGNAWTSLSNLSYHVFGGTTTVRTNCTLTLGGDGTGTTRGLFEQNIIDDGTTRTLNLIGFNQGPWVEMAGDNRGFTGAIKVKPHTATTQPIVFTGTNGLGGGSFLVSTSAYAGLAFDFTTNTLQRMSFEDGAVLGVDSNSAVNIDLTAIGHDIWVGSARGAVYTGTITPFGSAYRLCGGGGGPLYLPNTNALVGACSLLMGDTNSFLAPGTLVLSSSNSYSGGTVLSASKTAAPSLIMRAQGALGTGAIQLNRGAAGSPLLQFDTNTVSPAAYTISNDISVSNGVGSATINAMVPTYLTGSFWVYGTNGMGVGTNQLSLNSAVGGSLLALNPGAGKSVQIASNNNVTFSVGLFDPIAAANLPASVGLNIDLNGTLVLSSGYTWSNLVTGRTYSNNSKLPAGAWKASNFAARGAPQVIDATGAFQASGQLYMTNTWLLNGNGQSTPFQLGSVITNSDGSFYANASVNVARDIVLTNGVFFIGPATTGPGVTNGSDAGIVHELSGTLSGPGTLSVIGRGGTANAGRVGELVLSGSSIWSLGMLAGYSSKLSTGPGGMAIAGSGPTGFVRFKGNSSLPSGNAGATAFIFAGASNGSYNNVNGLYGYLLTGAAGVNQVYCLANGMRFLIGGGTSNSYGSSIGTIGSAYGQAMLTNSMICVFNDHYASSQLLRILVRDTNSTFTLGSSAGSAKFSSVYTATGAYNGNNWAPTNCAAEPMADRMATNTLAKVGAGVLVLSNVTYELFAGGGNIWTNFSWQLGSGTIGEDDGVVRETGTAANNSMRAQQISMNGAVMGLASDFVAQMGTNATQVSMTNAAGGGFAAYNGNWVVTLLPWGSTNRFGWGTVAGANADCFMSAAGPLIMNARDADSAVTLASASTNAINLVTASGNYVVNVMDNPATNTDMAVMAIRLTSATNLSGATFTKMGPGTLVLTATNNDYQAATMVSNGTLIVNGAILTNRVAASSNLTVCAGATLGGTGTIVRAVSVLSGGTLEAGDQYTQTGTLTLSNNLSLAAGSSLFVNASPAGASGLVNVIGTAQVSGVVTGNVTGILSGDATLLQATGGVNTNGMTAALPRGYVIRLGGGNTQLNLHYSSPGFVIRIQ